MIDKINEFPDLTPIDLGKNPRGDINQLRDKNGVPRGSVLSQQSS